MTFQGAEEPSWLRQNTVSQVSRPVPPTANLLASWAMRRMYASMSPTHSGCACATMATYVAKEEIHVASALSPLISLSPGGFGGTRSGGRAANLSASAMLSGRGSRMSTNSSA